MAVWHISIPFQYHELLLVASPAAAFQ